MQWNGVELVGYFQLVGWPVDIPRFYRSFVLEGYARSNLDPFDYRYRHALTTISPPYANDWWGAEGTENADDLMAMMDVYVLQVGC